MLQRDSAEGGVSVCHTLVMRQTNERRIMRILPSGSPRSLVFRDQPLYPMSHGLLTLTLTPTGLKTYCGQAPLWKHPPIHASVLKAAFH